MPAVSGIITVSAVARLMPRPRPHILMRKLRGEIKAKDVIDAWAQAEQASQEQRKEMIIIHVIV